MVAVLCTYMPSMTVNIFTLWSWKPCSVNGPSQTDILRKGTHWTSNHLNDLYKEAMEVISRDRRDGNCRENKAAEGREYLLLLGILILRQRFNFIFISWCSTWNQSETMTDHFQKQPVPFILKVTASLLVINNPSESQNIVTQLGNVFCFFGRDGDSFDVEEVLNFSL